ncbi:TetR/AcrR family transcriptional regulator [Piscicoccus intestinalis]|uniref:TetR/AcrR family transcriptional regulator n=1 Tax=Piscicoccus intestinalis TaxID=746033 RepID=UPI000839369B|nr:TetR/AcrR family transcriptional regulator [Piscicoccus intestinalis]
MSTARGVRLPRSARRAQLLEAAQAIFVDRGYHAAGMDEIAERAGVSKPVLYQHFPGKRELYLALLDTADEEIISEVLASMQSSEDNKERVQATISAYFEFVARKSGAYRLVFESDLVNDPEVRSRIDVVQEHCAQAVAELIRHDTDFSDHEALLLATGVVGMAQVAARHWLATGKEMPQAQAVQLVSQLAWRGMRGLPRTDGDAKPGQRATP